MNRSISRCKGTVFFLSANVLPEDAADRTVTWSTSDEGICTVDDLGMVTANSTGVCVIRLYHLFEPQ